MKRKKPWGCTFYGPHKIHIFKSFVNHGYDGITFNRKYGYAIELSADIFQTPTVFDEVLLHELCHVIEMFHGLDFTPHMEPGGTQCSDAVRLLGSGLAQMLRELRAY